MLSGVRKRLRDPRRARRVPDSELPMIFIFQAFLGFLGGALVGAVGCYLDERGSK